ELEQKQQALQEQAVELVQRTTQLEAANKELETFSYSVSHDLRAPLRAIDGFSLALAEDYSESLDDTGLDYLNRVRNSAQRMGHLIDDMLQLSRVNNSIISVKNVDLKVLAREVMDGLQSTEPDRKIVFSLGENLQVEGDPRLLRIMLDNLLGNAWKFTSKNDKVLIKFDRLEETPEVFFIRDNGAGFNMDHAKKLFGAFQRLHRMTDFPGTGIGLATVQRILNRHGGKIWVKAKEGEGATFYFSLGTCMK
ncbi:MAG: ATP-binding protein, partial [Methylococcales bacterium]